MRGSAQLPALHHRGLESMLAGGVRIACTFESARRTAHAQRSASSLRSILLQFDGRAAAPMLAKRPRGSGSSAAPSPSRRPSSAPRPSRRRARQISQANSHAKRLRSSALFWTDLPTRPGHRRRAGPPDLRGPTETGAGKRSSFLGTAAATGGSARLPENLWTAALLCAFPIPARRMHGGR
eukprot:tig00021070_g17893.t1